jgi:hypothetical protein
MQFELGHRSHGRFSIWIFAPVEAGALNVVVTKALAFICCNVATACNGREAVLGA